MRNTLFITLLLSVVAFSLISCGGGSSSKKSATPTGVTPPTGGTGGTGGDGTGGTGDPITYTCTDTSYEPVHDVASLKAIGENAESMAKSYCLAKDIDLAGVTSGFPLGWNTVEADITAFIGNFDGQNKTISNLVVNRVTYNYIGLFAKIGGATSSEIKDLNLNNFKIAGSSIVGALAGNANYDVTISKVIAKKVNISGRFIGRSFIGGLLGIVSENAKIMNSAVIEGTITGKGNIIGGLVGAVNNSTVSNSYATGSVIGDENAIGGLVGQLNFGGIILNSYAINEVKGNDFIGGLVGDIDASKVLGSYATGAVTGNNRVGGLVGIISKDGRVSNNYATGDVIGTNEVGGLVGIIKVAGRVLHSYATGVITATVATSSIKGGLVGRLNNCTAAMGDTAATCSVTNSYFDKTGNSGIEDIGDGRNVVTTTGLFGVDGENDIMKSIDGSSSLVSALATKIFDGWNPNIWRTEAKKWPVFQEKQCQQSGWKIINDVAGLKAIGDDAASMANSYCLMADIDLDGETSGFPLGWAAGYADIIDFTGNFDGEGHTISNLVIDESANSYIGLFSQIKLEVGKSREIKNLNLNDFRVTGKEYVGALTGSMSGVITISKVKINNAMINGTDYVGGLMGGVGGESNKIIDSAVIGGTVAGKSDSVGGMIGNVEGNGYGGPTISNSYATSDVSGANHVGGLVGRISTGGTILNSYATGRVTGSGRNVGGLVGELYVDGSSAGIKVSNNYATGAVKGKSNVGGLIGKIHTKGVVSNSYATGMVTATGAGTSKGGLIGELYYCTTNECSVTNSYFDKSANSGITAIGETTGTATITGLVGVDGASDIGVAAGGGFQTISSPNDKIFVDWNKDAAIMKIAGAGWNKDEEVWQFATGAWPTFKP